MGIQGQRVDPHGRKMAQKLTKMGSTVDFFNLSKWSKMYKRGCIKWLLNAFWGDLARFGILTGAPHNVGGLPLGLVS